MAPYKLKNQVALKETTQNIYNICIYKHDKGYQ